MRQWEPIETQRLVLRRPKAGDAEAIFERYASDPDVTQYLAWPRHRSVEDTRLFLEFCDAEWSRRLAGPYLIDSKDDGRLLGATGLSFAGADSVTTGYVLAKDAWGRGYATEALAAMVELARQLGFDVLAAYCHPDHAPSIRVLDKCGFARARVLPRHSEFPNLTPGTKVDVARYELKL